ncbi:MAG: hypothetical protein L0332_35785 [Chloroflexi bacterium]|nr:hypothetical protein [Chloroflexota bacterium]
MSQLRPPLLLRRFLPTPGNVFFTLLAVTLFTWAQSTNAFSRLISPANSSLDTIAYQGRLADASGNPLSGTYGMTFRLYNVASGGSPLWTEQWSGGNAVQVSDGLFNVLLGSFVPIPPSVFTDNATLWLGLKVGADNEMLPRIQLGSVPFAAQALTVPDGAITTAKIAEAAVTSDKLDAIDAFSFVSTQENTSSPTWTSLPSPDVVTFSLTETQWVNIYYGATTGVNQGFPAYMALSIDGGPVVDNTVIEQWSGTITISGFYRIQLSPGNHAVAAQYQTQTGGTASYWRRRILVFAISQ